MGYKDDVRALEDGAHLIGMVSVEGILRFG